MRTSNNIFAPLVALSGKTFEHVSENFAKHLPYQHEFSSKRHPADQADGMTSQGGLVCNDGLFIANERVASYKEKNGGADYFPATGDVIALCEWPTEARIHNLRFFASVAADDPDSFNTNYFPADTAAAFPAFTLSAIDPNDPTFEIPLLKGSGASRTISLQALAFGVNRRNNPLIIAATLGGSVVANSGLFIFADFVVPHS